MAYKFERIVNGETGGTFREKVNSAFSYLLEGGKSVDKIWDVLDDGVGRQYLHIRFSDSEKITSDSIKEEFGNYMGLALTTEKTAPTLPKEYVWVQISDDKGIDEDEVRRIMHSSLKSFKKDIKSNYLSKTESDTFTGKITYEGGLLVKSAETDETSRTALTNSVEEITTDSEKMTENFSEEGDIENLTLGVQEVVTYKTGGISTLGGLENASNDIDLINESEYPMVLIQEVGSAKWIKVSIKELFDRYK